MNTDLGVFCKYIDNGKKDLLIAFSSISVPEGKFSCSNAFDGADANILFVNCPSNSWYINEVFPGCNNWLDNINYLTSLINDLTVDDSKVITFGGSMGGYGALLYGLAVNADFIFATGVEHLFFIEGGNTSRFFKNKVNKFIPDLHELSNQFTGKAYLIYGEHFQPDICCAYDLSTIKGVNVCTLKNKPHSVPPYIHQKYGLNNFVFSTIACGYLPFSDNEVGDLLAAEEHLHVLHNAFMEVKRNKLTISMFNKLSMLKSYNIESESFVKYLNKYLGIFYYNFGDYSIAIEYFQEAIHKGLVCSELFSYISYAYFFNKEFKKSLHFSTKAIGISPLVSDQLVMRHIKNLIHFKRNLDALNIMKLHGNLNLAETNFQMSKILFSLSDESGALDYANTAVLKSPNRVPFIKWRDKLKQA